MQSKKRFHQACVNFEPSHVEAIEELIGQKLSGVSLRAYVLRQAGIEEKITPPHFATASKEAVRRAAKKGGKALWNKIKGAGNE